MRLPEQRLWDRMRNARKGELVRLQRLENLAGTGTPDVLAAHEGIVTFIELKAVEDFPKRPLTKVIPSGKGLSQDQMNWHLDWRNHKCRSIIVVSVGTANLFCLDSAHADHINTYNRQQLTDNAFATSWPMLYKYLRMAS